MESVKVEVKGVQNEKKRLQDDGLNLKNKHQSELDCLNLQHRQQLQMQD